MRTTDTPILTLFPPPHPWATWSLWRTPQFKTHATIGQAKNALSGRLHHSGGMAEGWLYHWNGEEWVELNHVPAGTLKANHPLWTIQPKRGRPVSDKQVDDAITSIRKTMEVTT